MPRSILNSDGCQRAFATATANAAHFTANLPFPKETRSQMGRCPIPQLTRQLPAIEKLSGFGAEPQLPITPKSEPRFCAWIARSFRRSGNGAPLTSIGVSFLHTGEERKCVRPQCAHLHNSPHAPPCHVPYRTPRADKGSSLPLRLTLRTSQPICSCRK